ncbi:MAG: hypothetical protein P8N21_03725 [Opitutales bacterium]|nr:hypothetical protein [Opitutales bacterium]
MKLLLLAQASYCIHESFVLIGVLGKRFDGKGWRDDFLSGAA